MIRFPLLTRVAYALARYPIRRVTGLLEESQWWPRERIRQMQNEKLSALVRHCHEHVPYYRRVMEERGLVPDDVTTVEDLPKLPVLTKDIVRAHHERLRADNVPPGRIQLVRTGGTTGEPMCIPKSKWDSVWERACYLRGMAWGGLLPTTQPAQLFGGSLGQPARRQLRDRVAAWFHPPVLFLPAFELSRATVAEYARRVREARCRHIIGYTSALYLFAELSREAGETLRFEAAFPTAEILLDTWRETIGEVFSCKVLPYYGCGEVNSLAYTCPEEGCYHSCDEHAILEVETGEGEASLAGRGALLVTDLDHHAMPLLRYRNGDAAVIGDEPCPCGRGLGRIVRLEGRTFDVLLTCDGTPISGAIGAHTFVHVLGVRFYQFVQDRPGQVLVRLVVAPEYDRLARERQIRGILRDHLGPDAEIGFDYVDDIERTPAGKAKFVINRCLAKQRQSGSAGE